MSTRLPSQETAAAGALVVPEGFLQDRQDHRGIISLESRPEAISFLLLSRRFLCFLVPLRLYRALEPGKCRPLRLTNAARA